MELGMKRDGGIYVVGDRNGVEYDVGDRDRAGARYGYRLQTELGLKLEIKM